MNHITDLSQGRYLLTTLRGTRHLLDLNTRTVVRNPAPGAEWDDPQLTPDGYAFPIGPHLNDICCLWWNEDQNKMEKTCDIRINSRVYFNNQGEWRLTSAVQEIEKLS